MSGKQEAATIQEVCQALRSNGFSCECFEEREEALAYLGTQLDGVTLVGMGGSMTLEELGVRKVFGEAGIEIVSRADSPVTWEHPDFRNYIRQFFSADLFLCSANAITTSGHLVYIEGTGDRVGPLLFGPDRCVVIAGKNKFVVNDAEGIRRIKNYVAPSNCRIRGYDTPCAKVGHCVNCKGPGRSCNATVILEQPTRLSNILVILINEDLGL